MDYFRIDQSPSVQPVEIDYLYIVDDHVTQHLKADLFCELLVNSKNI